MAEALDPCTHVGDSKLAGVGRAQLGPLQLLVEQAGDGGSLSPSL